MLFLLVRIVWFVLIGWWLSALVMIGGWLLNVTILGLPAGLFLLNRIPFFATLKLSDHPLQLFAGGDQVPFLLRAVYFIFVGWWFSLLWMVVAWLATITIILLPLGFWMFGRVGLVTTLKR